LSQLASVDAPDRTKKSGEVPSVWLTTACYAKLGGVPGQFLLRVKRGETSIVRTGDYNADTNVLGFG
jgi:hypothetical protein